MKLIPTLRALVPAVILMLWPQPARSATAGTDFDLVVVEATPGGIAMAVRAAREGLRVLLVNHTNHLGGILSSGLGVWDTLWEGLRAPIYDEARQGIFDYYRITYGPTSAQYRDALPGRTGHSNGKFEAGVAEQILTGLVVREKNITVLADHYPVAVEREGSLLRSVSFGAMAAGRQPVRIAAPIFADCSYEGDLAALAGVPFRIGREARNEFNEPHAGVIFMQRVPTAPTPEVARLAKLHARLNLRKFSGFQAIKQPGSTGAGDDNVQAFNYRSVLCSDPANRCVVEKPDGYDSAALQKLEYGSLVAPIPNQKRGWNRPQLVGSQTAYVKADWPARRQIMDAHWNATLGLLYFLQNDPSVAEPVRNSWRGWGLAKDEFADNGHRPYELYVREARRIVGRSIFTQHDAMLAPGLLRAPLHADSIAVTEWYLDSHACTPARLPGCLDEGKTMLDVETFPGQVPYRALLPQGLDNLLVPVCLSATHVGWGTIRLEPTWMNIGESAGFAAAQAFRNHQPPAAIDTERLLRTLAERHVMIGFFNDLNVAGTEPWIAAAQYFAAKGFFHDYDARMNEPLLYATAMVWAGGLEDLRAGRLDANALARAVSAAESRGGRALTDSEFDRLFTRAASVPPVKGAAPIPRSVAIGLMWEMLFPK